MQQTAALVARPRPATLYTKGRALVGKPPPAKKKFALKFSTRPVYTAPPVAAKSAATSSAGPTRPISLPKKPVHVQLAKPPQRPKVQSDKSLPYLREFNKKYLGIESFDETKAKLGENFYYTLSLPATTNQLGGDESSWKNNIPRRHQLWKNQFGKPDINHSFHQTPCFETTAIHILRSGFLSPPDLVALTSSHTLLGHLATSIVAFGEYDFRWIQEYNLDWNEQENMDPDRQVALTAALLHFDLDVSLLMRYLGHNYTGEYRNVAASVATLRKYNTPEDLIAKFRRVLLTGCPNHFVAETSRDNMLLYWRKRNGPTIDKKLDQVQKTMNKEDKNNFVIPLPHWVTRFIPHLFLTPQHILEKPGKKDRQIFDGSKRYTPTCTPLNMMTSTPFGSEDDCLFGTVRQKLFTRIYNLRISFPDDDIVLHANDVKSCFRQIKLHPDIMGAFSYIIADQLFLSCGLPFGTDFSPQNWEPLRQILEILAERLFDDDSLLVKHKKYLDQLVFDRSLTSRPAKRRKLTFTRAVADAINTGVLDEDGQMGPTPHGYYVDDGVYAEIFKMLRIKKAVAASIEAIFVLLGDSALKYRQDPVSFDKVIEMIVSHVNRILGHNIETRKLTVGVPEEFVATVLRSLRTTWGEHRKSFTANQTSELCGQLNHIAITAPWLKFLMTQVYASLSAALHLNEKELVRTSKSFRLALNRARHLPDTDGAAKEKTFYQGEAARQVHRSGKEHYINSSLREELNLIRMTLSDSSIPKCCPIAHLIEKVEMAWALCDSSLDAAGGYCEKLSFWWYIEWPAEIRQRTLRYIRNGKDGRLIDINVLEYASILITYLICCHLISERGMLAEDPHPTVLISGDNSCSESWSTKGAKHSRVGRALGRLQCALMLKNDVGLNVEHISTDDNVVADDISRIDSEDKLTHQFPLLQQKHQVLRGCQRFHLSSSLASIIMEMLLQGECIDPLVLSKQLRTDPGRIIS